MLDNAIQRINHYPAYKYYWKQSLLRYPLDKILSSELSAIQRVNNQGQVYMYRGFWVSLT